MYYWTFVNFMIKIELIKGPMYNCMIRYNETIA